MRFFTRFILLPAASLAALAALTACGHNLGCVVHGKFFNVGYHPEINAFGIQYVDGVMMTGLNKELSENKLKFIDGVEKNGIKTTTELDYTGKNGAQVTGYQVDMEKARQATADQIHALLDQPSDKAFFP